MGKFKRKIWNEDEVKILLRLFPNTNTDVIAKKLKCSYARVANKAFAMQLKKSEEFRKSELSGRLLIGDTRGNLHRYKKGQQPFNKGKTWKDFMSKEGRRNSLKTTFLKGHLPHNTKQDGEITIRLDKSGRPYKYIRIGATNKMMPLHVYNWIKANGKIPNGMIVVFKTKSTDNCNIENLEMISRADNMRRNTIHRYPEEIQSTIRILTKLKKTINGKEQNSRPA